MRAPAALILASLSAMPALAAQDAPVQARYAGKEPVEACSEPGAGECESLSNVRIMVGGFEERAGRSYSRAFLDGRPLWIKTRDVITMDTDFSLSRKRQAVAEAAECKRRGGASIGMTEAMVQRTCWGKPRRVNQTLTGSGRHQQWVYGDSNYLYFDNGVLTSIQTSR